jgi:two-component system alkaline phosphatase synthesis response regulator PhoP/two-component system response regulator VicR
VDVETRPLRILVCDDEKPIVRLIQVNLEGQGYEVHAAYDGKESLDKVREVQPDICILDIMMPFMDGYEVLRKIRRDPETQSVYVIMLTTAVTDEDRARGYSLGADMYLTKPFSPGEMARMIESG